MNELETYNRRIRKAVPQIKIESITINREGLMNDVVIVNGEIVFRLPKFRLRNLRHLRIKEFVAFYPQMTQNTQRKNPYEGTADD
jgi:hypothetical protein